MENEGSAFSLWTVGIVEEKENFIPLLFMFIILIKAPIMIVTLRPRADIPCSYNPNTHVTKMIPMGFTILLIYHDLLHRRMVAMCSCFILLPALTKPTRSDRVKESENVLSIYILPCIYLLHFFVSFLCRLIQLHWY